MIENVSGQMQEIDGIVGQQNSQILNCEELSENTVRPAEQMNRFLKRQMETAETLKDETAKMHEIASKAGCGKCHEKRKGDGRTVKIMVCLIKKNRRRNCGAVIFERGHRTQLHQCGIG